MNYIYVDSGNSLPGDGSLQNPYNDISYVFSLSELSHPVSVLIKSGSVFFGLREGNNNLFYNKTSQMSYISTYGFGDKPKFIQDSSGDYCFILPEAKNLTIRGIEFVGDYQNINPNHCVYTKPVRTDSDENANVWYEQCRFSAKPNRNQAWSLALRMNAGSGPIPGRVSSFGVRSCVFVGVPRGAWLLGNSSAPSSQKYNVGDSYYGYGIQCVKSSFIDVGGDGCIISNACSPDALKTGSEALSTTSGMFELWYSSERADKQLNASVAFWLSNCNKVLIHKCVVKGQYGSRTGLDKYAFDFDILCWECVVQYCYSSCNAGLLMTSNYAGQVSSRPSGISVLDWYYNNRYGNGNNLIHHCLSFNDGVSSTKPKILWQGYTFNLTIENVTIIDTVSPNVSIATMWQESSAPMSSSDGQMGIKIKNVLVYAPSASVISILNGDTGSGTPALTSVSYSDIYASSGVTPSYASGIVQSGNISSDPEFVQMPFSEPSTDIQAFSMFIAKSSPLFSNGDSSDYADYFGNMGSYIGAVSKG